MNNLKEKLNIETMKDQIEKETGLKLTARKGTGSMRGLTYLRPRKANGIYPKFDFNYVQDIQHNASIWAAFPDAIIVQ